MISTQVRPVWIVIGHGVGIEEGIHSVPVTAIDDFVQVHPVIDHVCLAVGQPGSDFSPCLCGQDEIGFGERG
ncbi:hypothetical protein BF95_26940 [Sphingobium sp. Ant17]|nr:hypothetical protein BF95_26940 [Sphingobium sp. Ant17]